MLAAIFSLHLNTKNGPNLSIEKRESTLLFLVAF